MQESKLIQKEINKIHAKRYDMNMAKKGNINLLVASIIGLVFAIVVLVLGLVVVQELRDTQGTTTDAWKAANKSLDGLGKFSDFIEILVLAVVITVVISLLVGIFGGRRLR